MGLFVLALLHRWVIALRAALEFSVAKTGRGMGMGTGCVF